jgi:hypothetical protein
VRGLERLGNTKTNVSIANLVLAPDASDGM